MAQVIIGLRKRRIPHRVHLSARNRSKRRGYEHKTLGDMGGVAFFTSVLDHHAVGKGYSQV